VPTPESKLMLPDKDFNWNNLCRKMLLLKAYINHKIKVSKIPHDRAFA
jgi:hypothetical protein